MAYMDSSLKKVMSFYDWVALYLSRFLEDRIRTLSEKENYRYLGILEADTIKQVEMKEKNNQSVCQTNDKASWYQVLR